MPFNNPNADWLNFRGTWVTNVLIAVALKGLFACVPGMTNELAWTLTNLTYNIGEYSALTLWEQIDEGEQYTPTRKFLMAFPVFLFLMSAHYTHYDLTMFCINLAVLAIQLIAKMPQMHRVRILGINKKA